MGTDPIDLKPDTRVRFPGDRDVVVLVQVKPGPYWDFVFRTPDGRLLSITLDETEVSDIEIVSTDTGAGALEALRESPCDCVVLDLRLPDMSGFEVLDQIRNDEALSNVPVVVFTGRELSAEEDAELHTMARSIVVKGVESPERLLDETSLFLHRVITELPLSLIHI